MLRTQVARRAFYLSLAVGCWLLPTGQAGAVCLGIGAAQSCSDGLNRTYTADSTNRRVIALNKPLLPKKTIEPIPAPNTDSGLNKPGNVIELKAADRALNFAAMYPGFGTGGAVVLTAQSPPNSRSKTR
jgi:hypothetical protein